MCFNDVLSKLKAINYPVEKKDVNLETASTYFMLQDRDRWSFSVQISAKDSIVYISGKLKVTAAGGSTNPGYVYVVRNKGMKGSSFKKAFTLMNDFALSLNGEISYAEK